MLLDGGYSKILEETLDERCKHNADPSVLGFFRSPREEERPKRSRTFHRWVSSALEETSTDDEVREIARSVAEELVDTPTRLMRELLVGVPDLMAPAPTWIDGAPLYDAYNGQTGRSRFSVVGGNRLYATGDTVRDLKRAYARLIMLHTRRPFSRSEVLRVYCAPERVAEFEQAQPSVRFSFEVSAQRALVVSDPWALARRRPVASVRISKPSQDPPPMQAGVMFGAQFEVWLDDPIASVRVERDPN